MFRCFAELAQDRDAVRDFRDNSEPQSSTPSQEAFEGRFESVPVERVLRTVPSGVVDVHSRGQVGRVVLAAGRPVHAELGRARGPEAVYRLVGVGGSFRVESTASVDVQEPTIERSLDDLASDRRRCSGSSWPRGVESLEQWEAAARGPDGRRYPWGDTGPTLSRGNFCGHECRRWKQQRALPGGETMYPERDDYPGIAPVGSFPEGVSPYGALDMAGNVFEWTAEQVRSSDGSSAYVIRGGAFNGFRPEFAAAALRFPQDPAAHTHGIGFRCVSPPVSR